MVGLTWRGGPADGRRPGPHAPARGVDGLAAAAAAPRRTGPGRGGVPGLRATEPLWTGDCDAIDVRAPTAVPALTLSLIAPGRDPVVLDPARRFEPREPTEPTERRKAPKPDIVRRRAWGANEKWRNGGPWFNRTIQQVHVHHTVNSNDYAPEDVPALLRGIYRYHTKNLGWSDIGYNFLVDRFGRHLAGPRGRLGARRPRRAHARLQQHLDRHRGDRELRGGRARARGDLARSSGSRPGSSTSTTASRRGAPRSSPRAATSSPPARR